jgi:ribokinase
MSTPSPRPVFVIGSFVMACCWFTPRLPGRGEHVHADGFLMEPGGKGLNVAVGLRRLGAPVHLLLGVGDDSAAEALLGLLRREGLSDAHVHRFAGPSGHGVGLIDEAGDNVIAVHPGANHRLGRGHVHAAATDIAASALVYGQFEAPDGVIAEAFRLARQAGVTTVLNPSPWRPIASEVLQQVDTLLLNEHEARALWGAQANAGGPTSLRGTGADPKPDPHGSVRAWRRAHPGVQLLVTLGEAGCWLWPAGAEVDSPRHHPATRVQAVDTTGCGDAFAAAWCQALAAGMDASQALHLATSAGAWVASRQGVLGALPSGEELRAWMRAACP